MNDVTFFKPSKNCGLLSPLPLNASKHELLPAVAAKLHITEQRNSFKGLCVHHGALKGQIFACPLKAQTRQVACIRMHTSNRETLLCSYWDSFGRGNVTERDMRFHMKFATEKIRLSQQEYHAG